MKTINWMIVTILTAVVLISPATKGIYGFQDSGIGEYVNVAPLKIDDWTTPPGHYGLMASYANTFLSAGPSNGNYVVTWDFVKNNLSEYFVVDVRSNAAYCTSHIIGSINIPYATVAKPYNLDKLPTDQPILVVCSTGIMSGQVAAILGMMGYQVRILSGGIGAVPSASKTACQ